MLITHKAKVSWQQLKTKCWSEHTVDQICVSCFSVKWLGGGVYSSMVVTLIVQFDPGVYDELF